MKTHKNFGKMIALFLIFTLTIQTINTDGFIVKANTTEKSVDITEKKEPPYIIREATNLRDEYSKSYLQSDNTYLQVTSMEPIHYLEEGQYKEIDNRLKTSKKGDSTTYQNKQGTYQVSFPENLQDSIDIQYNNQSLSITLLSDKEDSKKQTKTSFKKHQLHNQINKSKASKEQKKSISTQGMSYEEILPEQTTGEIEYTDTASDVSIKYQAFTNQIKESILIDDVESAKKQYIYEIKADGMKAKKESDGSILLYKKNEKNPVYTLEAPFMFDNAKESNVSTDIDVKLDKKGKTYQVTYTPSRTWITDEARVYPITIDPTIIFDQYGGKYTRGTLSKACYINAKAPSTYYPEPSTITLASGSNEALLIQGNYFMKDTAVLNATLYLNTTGSSDAMIGVKRITSSWNPNTVTWNTRPTVEANWLDYATVSQRTALDITSYIQRCGMKNQENEGLQFEWFAGGSTTFKFDYYNQAYIITEYAYSSDTIASNHNISAGRAGNVIINDFTGNLRFECEDLAIPGNRMPVSIKRVRSAHGVNDVGMGNFFQTNYHQRIHYNVFANVYEFCTETGGTVTFSLDNPHENDEAIEDDMGSGYTIDVSKTEVLDNLDEVIITNPEGNTLHFDYLGRLVTIKGKKQKEISSIQIKYVNEWNQQIDKLVDGAGGRYQFIYTGDLCRKIDYIGKTGTGIIKSIEYQYDVTNNKFIAIHSGYNKYVQYKFDTNKNITEIRNIDGSLLKMGYYERGNIFTVNTYGSDGTTLGDGLTYTYDTMQTTIQDRNGNSDTYQFDRKGNITSVRNQQGEAVFASYGGKQGQLLGVSKIRSTEIGENLIQYDSYENQPFSTGSYALKVEKKIHDKQIPILEGKPYDQISPIYQNEIKKKLVIPKDFKKGDAVTFGGWIKGNFQGKGIESQEKRGVTITAVLYPNGDDIKRIELSPNIHVSDWQYILEEITLEQDMSCIIIEVNFTNQANPFCISNLEFKKHKNEMPSSSPEPSVTEIPLPTPVLDSYGNVLRQEDKRGAVTEYTYDEVGNEKSKRTRADGKELFSRTNYDIDKNMVTSAVDTTGVEEVYDYQSDKKLSGIGYDLEPGYKKCQYNESGEVIEDAFYESKSSYNANNPPNAVVNYGYENDKKTITTKNNTYSMLYNVFGDISEIKRGDQRLSTYQYKSNSNRIPTKITYGNGQEVSYTYNKKNQLESDDQGAYAYDEQGELVKVTDTINQTRTEYSKNQTFVYNNTTSSLLYQYEEKDGGFSFEKNGSKVSIAKQKEDDLNGILEEAFSYNGKTEAIEKTTTDKLGRLYQNEIRNSNNSELLKKTYSYRAQNTNVTTEQVSNISYVIGNGTTESDTYTYDYFGNITSIQDKNGVLKKYSYDKFGQLEREDDPVQDKSIFYTYSEGNLTKKQEYKYTTTSTKGEFLSQTDYGYNHNWKDLLTSYNGQSIEYDSIGNPTTYRDYTLEWEKGRQLKSNTKNGTTTSYTYDVNGLRTKKKVGSTTHEYSYQNGLLLAYEEGSNKMMFLYDETGNPVGLWYNDSKYYYQTNLQGDVIGIINESGSKVASYSYDAWGKPVGTIPSSGVGAINPLRYRGYVYDVETGLYYVSSRYYDPETCRFINTDEPEMLLGLASYQLLNTNLFTYCYNNPVMHSDPSGELVQMLVGAAFAAVTTYMLYWVEWKLGMRKWNNWVLSGQVILNAAMGATMSGLFGGPLTKLTKLYGLAQKMKLSGPVMNGIKLVFQGTKFLINMIVKSMTRKPGESWLTAVKRLFA